jgi:Phasin protein
MAKAEDDKRAETRDNARARARAVARTKASEAVAKPNESEVTEAAIDDSAEIREETLAKTNDIEATEMREDAGTETEHEQDVRQNVRKNVRTESKVDDVAVQEFGTRQLESKTSATSSFLDTLQAIAAEASDYSRRSLENRSSFVAKLLGATTFESTIQVQSEHAKTSYAGFIAYLMRMAELRASLAKTFFKPIETAITKVQGSNK